MFLKRLEINGFKSFASKTVFEFPAGIVSIVGPNGSGKSNVIDAIRWLLGEREAKNLRGAKIEDLIFSGTAKKQKMSMAQVSLVFDNSKGNIPVDFKEVVVSRSINRNSDSKYFINDSEVRLKDIIDFFSKIKLGTKGLTIIGQGAGDIFVKATPTERMMMVQEILGLKEYQLKKNEAERKLKNTRINLEKISAMMGEAAPRLRMLKKQTSRWEKRFEVDKELEDLENKYFSFKIKNLIGLKEKAKSPLESLLNQTKEASLEVSQAEKELKKIEDQQVVSGDVSSGQKEKKGLFEKKSLLEKEFFRIEAEIEFVIKQVGQRASFDEIEKRISNIKNKLNSVLEENDIEEIRQFIKKIINELNGLLDKDSGQKHDISTVEKKRDEIKKQIDQIEKEISLLEEKEFSQSKQLEEFNSKFRSAFENLESSRNRLQNFERDKEKIIFEEEKISYRLEDIKNQIHSIGKHFKTFEDIAISPSYNYSFSDEEIGIIEKKMLRLRGELASIGEIDQSIVNEAQEVESHYNFLNKESNDLSGAIENLSLAINELNDKINSEFRESFLRVNEEFHTFFRVMFGGGHAKMKLIKKEISEEKIEDGVEILEKETEEEKEVPFGIDIDLSIPQKKITSLEMLSGGEKSLVSLAVLFALISVSPPPFLVLDEADSALDEKNSKRFSDLIKNFSSHSQFIIVTHNRVIMESADVLYGVTMDESGASKILSLKLEDKN
ncbi:MAG: AAA family ATPase [Candidatus Paceibacterota bacterium]|jgi:chromosome segregation protein